MTREQADALGVLVRAGVAPQEAATRVGLPGLEFSGVPVSLRLDESEAGRVESR